LALAVAGRHLGDEAQTAIGIDLRPKNLGETLEKVSQVGTMSQDRARVPAQQPSMNEEEVTRGCAHQQDGRVAGCPADCREEPCQRPKDGAIRQVERGVGHAAVVRFRGTEPRRSQGGRRRPEGWVLVAHLRLGSPRNDA